MTIRKMKRRDVGAVTEIFNYYIQNTTNNWQRDLRPKRFYKKWFKAHDECHPAFVLEKAGKVVGVASLSAFRGADGYDRVLENSLYIMPGYKGMGYGKQLMETLIDEAKRLDLWAITAWIDANNTSSIAFHKKYGFYETGTMKNVGNKDKKRLTVSILQLDF